jgi:hypothetical protein
MAHKRTERLQGKRSVHANSILCMLQNPMEYFLWLLTHIMRLVMTRRPQRRVARAQQHLLLAPWHGDRLSRYMHNTQYHPR